MTPLRRLALAATAALALLALPAAASAACPENATCTDAYFPSGDGTQLHADVILPKGRAEGDRHPVILAIGPYFAHVGQTSVAGDDFDPAAEGPNERFKDLYTEGKIFEKGYALIQVDLRGFGASSGCNDFGGPGEQADAKAAVEWAASQPWSNGRVGMWGKSYDGWTQVMALNGRPKGLAAAVIMSPIIDGYRTLYQNGVHYEAGWYATPGLYQAIDASPPSVNDSPEYWLGTATGTNPACYGANIALQNATMEWDTPFWKERDLPNARGSDVPVLWSHGLLDANTKPDNFLPVFSTLTGPRRAWVGQYTHIRPQDKTGNGRDSATGRNGFIDEAMRWLDRYVKGVPADQAPVENDPAVEVEDGATMKYRAEAAWPPADAVAHQMPIRPGTTENSPGNDAEVNGEGIWSASQVLPHDVHMAGAPKFTFAAEDPSGLPRVNVFGVLYDINERNEAKLVTRGAYAVTSGGPVSYELYPQDWTFKAGHRIGFAIAPSDDTWYTPPNQTGGSVSINKAALSIPFLKYKRSAFLPSRPSDDERARPEPFAVSDRLADATVNMELPAPMVDPPVVTVPMTPTKAAKAPKVSARLRALRGRRLVASGVAPTRMRLTVRLVRGRKTVSSRRVTARRGRWTVRYKRVRRGSYRVVVSGRRAGMTVRVRSNARRVR